MIITRSRFEVNGKDLVLMETYGIVYLLIDGTNDKEYVGQTTRTVVERFKEHKKSDFLIGRAIRAHDEENFVIAILKECETSEELGYWEKHFIKSRNTMSPNGYNLTDGGERNFIMLPETRAKMSASHSGEKNYNFGVPMPAEQRAKLSAARKGKPLPPETCAKMSASRLGKKRKPFSPEHRAKLSVSHTGKTFLVEQRAKMSESRSGEKNPNYGVPMSNEQRIKISITKRPDSPYKNLLKELDARQLSYNFFADLLEISASSVSLKMKGNVLFTNKDVTKLAEIFGKPIEYLLYRDDEGDCAEIFEDYRNNCPFKNLIAEIGNQNLSYKELAKLLNISIGSVSLKMRSKICFMDSEKKKLAEIFGKPIEFLLAREE